MDTKTLTLDDWLNRHGQRTLYGRVIHCVYNSDYVPASHSYSVLRVERCDADEFDHKKTALCDKHWTPLDLEDEGDSTLEEILPIVQDILRITGYLHTERLTADDLFRGIDVARMEREA